MKKFNNTIKVPKITFRNIILITLLVVYCLTASDTVIGGEGSLYKYAVLSFGILYEFLYYLRNRKKKLCCKNEFKKLIFWGILVLIYSFVYAINVGHFSFRTIQELIFYIFPIIYGFLFVNNSNSNEIKTCLTSSFYCCFILYIVSLGMNFNSIINSLLNSSFIDSSSQLESAVYSGISLAFSLYFIYAGNNKQKILSLLFVFMTFKRLSILTAIILLIVSFYKKISSKSVSNRTVIISTILILILTLLVYFLINPENVLFIENKFNLNVSKLTMTRSDRYKWLLSSNYQSYGFGSSNELMYSLFNGALEMDLIRIIVELGLLPLIVFIYSYLYLCKKNVYLYIFMFLKVASMIVTSCLTSSISWTLIYIIIFSLIKEEKNYENFNNNTCL